MAIRSSTPPKPPDAVDFGGREGAFDGGFWTRLAMGCDQLSRTLNEASAPLQDRRSKGPDRAGFRKQGNIAIGAVTAIVRAISMAGAGEKARARQGLKVTERCL
jgi:hypothetical protein